MLFQNSLETWANRLLELSESYLTNITFENSALLNEHFATHKQFEPEKNWLSILKEISRTEKGKLIAVALYMCNQKLPAKQIWNRYRDTDINFTQLAVYGLLISNGYMNYSALEITSHFPASGNARDSDFINEKVKNELKGQDSPDSNLIRLISNQLTKNSPTNYLATSLLHSDRGVWKDRFGWIFEKCQLDVQITASIIPTDISREILGQLILEYQASHGNIKALESLIKIGKVAAANSHLKSVPISSKVIMDLALIQLKKSLITPTIFDAIIAASNGSPPYLLVSNFGHLRNFDPLRRAIIIDLLDRFGMRDELISFAVGHDIKTLTKSEYKLLLKSAQMQMDVNLLLKLNSVVPIEDADLIIRLAAKLVKDGQKETGMSLLLSRKLFLSDFEYKILTLNFLRLLGKQYLFEYDLENPIQDSKLVSDIATYLHNRGATIETLDPYLHRAIRLGSSRAAMLYTEIHDGETFEREILKLASKESHAYLAKREYAKLLILDGELELAAHFASEAAYHDNQAAHLLIHILGKDVEQWSHYLDSKNVHFKSSEYEDIFRKSGLSMVKSSELETNCLHDIYVLRRNGVPARKIAKNDYIVEKWWCNKAILDTPRVTWADNACENHREDVAQFSKLKMIRPLTDVCYEEVLNELRPHSRPFNYLDSGYLGDALKSQPLRSWQIDAIDAWVKHGRQGIIEAATGSGKSKVGALAALEAMNQDFAVVIVVPTRILQQQWIHDYFSELWSLPVRKIWTMGNKDEEGGTSVIQKICAQAQLQ